MGVIWGVQPYDLKCKGMAQEQGVNLNYPTEGNRLPTVGEIRAALKSIEGLRFKESWVPKGGEWQASIQTEDDSTIINVMGATGDSSPPKDIWLEKGFDQTVAEILAPFAVNCGYLFVTDDRDSSFFIITPDGPLFSNDEEEGEDSEEDS